MPVAVVTGANSGIGHAFADILVKEVDNLLPTTNLNIEELTMSGLRSSRRRSPRRRQNQELGLYTLPTGRHVSGVHQDFRRAAEWQDGGPAAEHRRHHG